MGPLKRIIIVPLLAALLIGVGGLPGALTTTTGPILEAITGTPMLTAAVPQVYAGVCSVEIEICYQDICVRIKIEFSC